MTTRSPRELIEIYWERVYNNAEPELIREVCADPIVRHDPGVVTPLSHDEQIVRVQRSLAMKPLFTHRVLHADDTFVTSVWNMVDRVGRGIALCGIEVFEAHDGRFTRCWNSSYEKGLWGEDGDEFDPASLPSPALVSAPGEISADWFQRALAAGGVVAPQRLAMEPEVTPIGHGTTSATVRIRASYNSGHVTAPASAICKIGKWPGGGGSAGPFARERQAYALFAQQDEFRVPQLYFSAGDEAGLSNLLIENVAGVDRDDGYFATCSIVEAGVAVAELARFHRHYVDAPLPDWLCDYRNHLPSYVRGAQVLRDWMGDRLTAAQLAAIDRLGDRALAWLDQRPALRTLIHCDPRIDNIMFEQGPEGLRACLLDWQGVSSGDPQSDVAYLLATSLTTEDRRACERALIGEHAMLMAETTPGYTLQTALEGYRRNVVSGLWMTVVAAAYVEHDDYNERLIALLIDRTVATVEDWDGLAAIG
ncbi:aminoglycoside phosphotransferase family protein [Novosphingobium sp. JCM 18896]|uniref:aminoglycoside phosphotransferase family protein n=1 Tax=Novosphingobium sp. JCM 18896 TaxID=2989731 RepID=UPI002222C972|nr:aminoglycoside phosphotransferase family protein [Novosphingobium sp. JCM 18896]MCW1428329.1 aminoglycoside phosphotransferase family protein [Novosphingobium sp. JCM 18896]